MADTEMQGAALARDELCALAEQIQVDVAELVRRTALPPYDGQPYMFDGRAWVRLAAESTRSTADEQPPTESRRIDSLNEAELERAGITVRWNEEPGVPWDEARFYDAAGNELEPEHCVDLPAAGVRPPAEERDDLDDYIAEVRAKDSAFGAAYDDAVARLLRDHPSALAAVATKALSAPLATHYPGDGQPAEERTEWGVDYGISGQPALKSGQEEAVRVLALYRALNQSRHVETGAPLQTGRLLRRTVTVGPWVPADAPTPEVDHAATGQDTQP